MVTGYVAPAMPANESARAAAVVASGLLTSELTGGLDQLALWARVAVGTRLAAVTAIVGEEEHLVGSSGMARRVGRRSDSFCGHTILAPAPVLCVPDARLDARFAGNPHVVNAPWLRFYAGVALATDDGLALGALCVFDERPRTGMTLRETRTLLELAEEAMRRLPDTTTARARPAP